MAEAKRSSVKKSAPPPESKKSDIEVLLDWCEGQGWTNVTKQFDKSDSVAEVKSWAQSINHSQVLARISEME